MNILCVLATNIEAKGVFDDWTSDDSPICIKNYPFKGYSIDILITGIGVMHTSCNLSLQLSKKKYNLVINLGIAGSFNNNYSIGAVVEVLQEINGDLGTEKSEFFKDLFDMQLMNKNESPYANGILLNNKTYTDLPKAKGISVNKIQTDVNSIAAIQKKYNPDIETMEGVAVFYTCLIHNIPFVEIRAISNMVAPYNKQNWDIKLALKNLKKEFGVLLEEMKKISTS